VLSNKHRRSFRAEVLDTLNVSATRRPEQALRELMVLFAIFQEVA